MGSIPGTFLIFDFFDLLTPLLTHTGGSATAADGRPASGAPAATPSCVVLAQNDFAEAAGERDGERSEIPGPPIAASSRLQV